MDKTIIDLSETDALLERAITVTIDIPAKWYQRKRTVKKEFLIKPLRLAQQKRIIGALSKVDADVFSDENTLLKVYNKMMNEHYEDMVYCIGVLLTENARNEPSDELIDLIKTNVDNEALNALWVVMVKQINPAPFLNGIILMKGIDLQKMNPKT